MSPFLCQHLLLFAFGIRAPLLGVKWHLVVAVVCIALITDDAEGAVVIGHLYVIFREMSMQILCPF